MSGADSTHDDHAHDSHHDHPVAATIVGVAIVLVFSWAFAMLNSGSVGTGVVTAGVLLLLHLCYDIWVLDRD